jgi:eukaryotic-like serine/threonine-protein kinase
VAEEVCPVRQGELVGGKYRVERTLGAGGMGVVVAATQIELDRPVALKFLLPKVLERPGLVTRFSREARAAAKLESEHVARVLDVGTLDGGAPYIVMEYLEGQDLASVIASGGALPCDLAVGYLLQACEAVAEAHSLGIVHRDLKPGNLFLANRTSGAPVIKVLDFGLSKFANTGEENVTSESSILGSPLYMSPEQLMSARTADARSDIWSLGVVLYEFVTAHAPFQYERIAGLVAAILQKDPQPIDQWGVHVPSGLQAVLARCLEKDPAHRFPSIAHLAKALAPFGPPGSGRSVDRVAHVLRRSVPPSEATVTLPSPLPPTEPDPNPRPTPEAESVAGSSRSIREPRPDATLASGPLGAAPRPRGRMRAGVVGGLGAAGVAGIAAYVALSRPAREPDLGLVSPSARVAAAPDGSSLAPLPPPRTIESADVEPTPAAPSQSPPLHATPAEPAKKRPRPAPATVPVAAPPVTAAPTSAPPAPPPAATSDDPLRRLKTM